MANEGNLKPIRSTSEARERGRAGGKASGRTRRKKADFKKTLNLLLTTDINDPNITPVLEALGIDSTLESAVNMAMIKEAMTGNVKAYEAIAKYSGQSRRSGEDMDALKADIELKKAKKQAVTGENESEDALNRLDSILKEIRDNATKQEAE